jgi:Holliday junction resolvasome RuvABC endonuclease subunit
MRVVGIDYSLSSPCVCIGDPNDFRFETCKFYYLTDLKKLDVDIDNIRGDLHLDYSCEEQRYGNITTWVMSLLKEGDVIYMEGYSMASTGRVFSIAENAGLLKHFLWKCKYEYNIIPPTVIKKFATGKGNANKQALQDCFETETKYYIKSKLGLTEKQWNPSSDIIDSYYICKLGINKELTNELA